MIKLWNVLHANSVYTAGTVHRYDGMVLVYQRTKRTIVKGQHTLQAERKAQWNGTLHTNGGPWFDGK